MAPRRRKPQQKYLMISAVAERYDIHPQTLRLYEREGLIRPARSKGNTRLYDPPTLDRLETILTLTRDMGINLAGVEVILSLREQLGELQRRLERAAGERKREDAAPTEDAPGVHRRYALVRVTSGLPVRVAG